ncbi:MAG: hypothetical protein UV74_C0013G0248 [Candidatus Woesebacteria bacterium GW2011_GWB1_43_14]|uniref:Uncharacterized protein n=1 Tax=Candidatus Woesebacteria bacterium GW2011_GWB1_43_14 TaxID=1618578 RepID=A0A0G1FQ32_9BACT|nr:MAG: hypothetical protein UT21_C0002G0045 [Candidatus Woesebacteria bacterium GW2011_GWA1_39_11b]KKS78458.1 MAG: hypothetical protein UV51_C0001G0174 [Candidatus Woesebacteria bacterium GW2011_GWC1_42_9]KKS97126.1 MAG: hypothetical protein UV74_C0013G0248 [Candidatus Woesebacteria bacterium GW2011_GWB1_43_14]
MTEEQPTTKQVKTKERSASYPSITLEDAINYSAKLQTAFSKSAFSRDNAVKEMGYEKVTGPVGMKVASLVHFGLLGREGNAYRNTDLSLSFAHPIDDNDLQTAKQLAVTAPKLYKTLLNEFAGHAVPTALSSILVRSHKIGQKVADNVANIFRKSIEYAGVYQNGIVSSEILVKDDEVGIDNDPVQTHANPLKNETKGSYAPITNVRPEMITVEFPSGIALSYPKNLQFAFNMGTFRDQMSALEKAVEVEIKKHESNNRKDDTSPKN